MVSDEFCISLWACAKPVPPPQPVVETTEPAAFSILGTWYDDMGDPHDFNEDGTVISPQFEAAAQAAVGACSASGFDVSACSEPRFLWRAHPSQPSVFLFAIRMPMTTSGEGEEPAQCFCLPEPGLPMIAHEVEENLKVLAVGPDGEPLPGVDGFTLTREEPAP